MTLQACIFFFNAAISQINTEEVKLYPIVELREDFNFWRKRFESKHPLIYLYNSQFSANNYFASILNKMDHLMSELAFYRLISPITSFFKDEHNAISPSKTTVNYFL